MFIILKPDFSIKSDLCILLQKKNIGILELNTFNFKKRQYINIIDQKFLYGYRCASVT